MSDDPKVAAGGDDALHRCIRDLAALNALPSMCVGRTPDGALDLVLDALPTALSCDLIYLALPGSPSRARASICGQPMRDAVVSQLTAMLPTNCDGTTLVPVPASGALRCVEASVPVGGQSGRLVAGRRAPFDRDIDRVLVRSAANLVGATLESANVLDAARRKDEFLAMLGHELRNPLAPILTAVELLARQPIVAREQQIIERNTRHLARLVDDLLDISRVTSGQIELRSQPVLLATALQRAIEMATPLITRSRHFLRADDAGDITLQGDPVRLAQIFGNLITNAAKFTPYGGKIEISVRRSPDRVRVEVQDNGRGIPKEQLGRIFAPFVQVDGERDIAGGGLGLGLAIVANLVERHGGTISARSDGQGRGATFVVELPTIARMAEQAAPVAPQPSATRAGVRVLVVDDNADIAELISDALRIEGFQTAVEHDAKAALSRWRQFSPHAAVLDVGLPDLDGYALAKALRVEHGRVPTLIAATGYGQPRDRLRAADAGFDCHLVKPVSVSDLVVLLDQRVVGAAATPAG